MCIFICRWSCKHRTRSVNVISRWAVALLHAFKSVDLQMQAKQGVSRVSLSSSTNQITGTHKAAFITAYISLFQQKQHLHLPSTHTLGFPLGFHVLMLWVHQMKVVKTTMLDFQAQLGTSWEVRPKISKANRWKNHLSDLLCCPWIIILCLFKVFLLSCSVHPNKGFVLLR